ncbi:MAG TPA: BON domain-containing protein [Anaeromyxobacter sp.]|nr:BON domain-containing protein [Anaeromyxobacter sp.]
MARWTEDRERASGWRGQGEDERRSRGEEGWRGRDWREDERSGDWRGGEREEWQGGAREWEAREREARERDRDRWMQGGGEGGSRPEGGGWERGREWRGGGGREGYGRHGERGGFGPGSRSDEDRYGPGTGRGASFGAGGTYGGTGGEYGGSSHAGSGLGSYGAYGGRSGPYGAGGGWRDEERWRGGERGFQERESGFTRDLRRRGDDEGGRGPLERMGDRVKEGWSKLTGRGPKGYKRSDERIREDVSERIARSGVNAEDVEVKVERAEVTLSGFVDGREDKRLLEDLADDVFGVEEVHDHLRLRREPRTESQTFTAGQGQAQGAPGQSAQRGQPGGQPQQPGARH